VKIYQALLAGGTGALLLNLVHESVRRVRPEAPRVDILGQEMLARIFRRGSGKSPKGQHLYLSALAADLLSNTLYYSLVGIGSSRYAGRRGLLLGIAGGLGTLFFPRVLNLSRRRVARTAQTRWMTVGWYTLGGISAGLLGQWMGNDSSKKDRQPQVAEQFAE